MTEGVWLVFYSDWSGCAVFAADDEIGALRYAVEHHMEVKFVPYGEDLRQAARA